MRFHGFLPAQWCLIVVYYFANSFKKKKFAFVHEIWCDIKNPISGKVDG